MATDDNEGPSVNYRDLTARLFPSLSEEEREGLYGPGPAGRREEGRPCPVCQAPPEDVA
jgi:hypothetical protein